MKSEDSRWELWNIIEQVDICIIGNPEETEKEAESLFKEIMARKCVKPRKRNQYPDPQILKTPK
jgi:hypothetical protein